MTDNQIAVRQDEPSPLAIREPSVPAMLQLAIERRMDPAGLEKLTDLFIKMDDRGREQAFAEAFIALQEETKKVKAMNPVMNKPDKGGRVRFTFANFESIMGEVETPLKNNNFSISFDSEFMEGGRVQVSCTLTHIKGHSRVTRFACRVGSGPPGASEAQADGAAVSYAKRFALCLALNIIVDKIFDGTDARPIGDFIPAEMAADLERRAERFPKKIPFLLDFAEATTFQEISQGAYKRTAKKLSQWEAALKEMPQRPAAPTASPGRAPCDAEGNLL